MMARRTRSINELPGHLRVPILRRKDTERTKERLAAGLAGMEELKSLRQHQQQLVGETMAKAEDRHERGQGEKSPLRHSYSCAQVSQPPRQPQRRSWSSFRGNSSMDSISEEGDGSVRNIRVDNENNNDQWDINNNNKDSRYSPGFNNMNRIQFSFDETQSWSTDSHPNSIHSDLASVCHSHIHQSYENETRIPVGQRQEKNNLNPAWCRNRTDTIPPQNPRGTPAKDKITSDLVTPARQSSMTEWHGRKPAPKSGLHRSMSVDLGHRGINPLSHFSLSKNVNSHKFSSLTCINTNNEDTNNNHRNNESPLNFRDASRLSQSTSQIDNVGHSHSVAEVSQKRRGSLTWDNLLKSIGIQNSSSLTCLDKCDGSGANDTGQDRDAVFESDNDKDKPGFVINRKVGRSMSFTCSNSTNLLKPKSTQRDGVSLNLGARSSPTENEQSLETNVYCPPQSIHPILRRASIQCEAVLTSSSRVVNPIKDVDVNSFKSPGPLHAVMLQYKGYNSPPGKTAVGQTINSSNGTTHTVGTQEVSKECLSSTTNIVENPPAQSSKASSNLLSELHDNGGESLPRSTPLGKQDPACDNVIQEDYLCTVSGESENPFTREECDPSNFSQRNMTSNTATNKEQNNSSVNGSWTHDRETKMFLEPSGVNGKIDSVSSKQPYSVKPRTTSRLHSSDTNDRGLHSSQESVSLAVDNKDGSSLFNRKTEEECDCAKLSNHKQLPNTHETSKTLYKIEPHKANNDLRNEKNSKVTHVKDKRGEKMGFDFKGKEVEHNGDEKSKQYGSYSPCEKHISNMTLVLNCQKPKDKVDRTLKGSGNTNSESSSPEQSPPGPQFPTQQILLQRDRDVIRGKRSSIFSDVSLISDSSGRTPSSAASTLSDVSIVSDEGYGTWGESASSESRFSTCLTSVCRPPSLAFTDSSRKESNRLSHPAYKVTYHDSKRDQQGNNAKPYPDSLNNDCDKETTVKCNYIKEITLERSAPVIFTPSEPSQNTNIPTVVNRKSVKQTTV